LSTTVLFQTAVLVDPLIFIPSRPLSATTLPAMIATADISNWIP